MPKRKASGYAIRVDSFEALDLPKRPTYQQVKREVLRRGRFSAFEASEHPDLFDELARDPEVMLDSSGPYPWTKVRDAEA